MGRIGGDWMLDVFLLVASVVLLSVAIVAAWIAGYVIGCKHTPAAPKPLDEQTQRKIERMQTHLNNFLTYDGTEQRR